MVFVDLHVVEDGQCVFRMDSQRAIERNQIGGDGIAVDAHEAYRQAGALFAWQARLIQTDDALALVADAQEQDLGLAFLDRHLVRRDQRDAAPGQELRAEQRNGRRWDAAAGALAAESGDRQRVSEEEGGFLPDLGQQIVEVIRRRRPAQRRDALTGGDVGQQAVIAVVDQFVLLPLLDRLDGQPQLFLDLVVRAAVQVRNTGVHVENGGDGAEEVLARLLLVVDEGLRQFGLVALGTGDLHVARVLDLVQAVDAGFDGQPLQQVRQPARRNGRKLRDGLGGVGELPCGDIAQGGLVGTICHGVLLAIVTRVIRKANKQITLAYGLRSAFSARRSCDHPRSWRNCRTTQGKRSLRPFICRRRLREYRSWQTPG